MFLILEYKKNTHSNASSEIQKIVASLVKHVQSLRTRFHFYRIVKLFFPQKRLDMTFKNVSSTMGTTQSYRLEIVCMHLFV